MRLISDDYNERDFKYMLVAKIQSLISKATDHRVGAILVRDNTIIASGYNGLPRGIREHYDPQHSSNNWEIFPKRIRQKLIDCMHADHKTKSSERMTNEDFNRYNKIDPRRILGYKSGEETYLVMHVHAELNCIINAARVGTSTVGSALYGYCSVPCSKCMMAIINAGITRVVCIKSKITDTEYMQESSMTLASQANIELINISMEKLTEYEAELKYNPLLT